MNFTRNNTITGIIICLGSVLLLLSEFEPWFSSQYSCWDLYNNYPFPVVNNYIFLTPLISSILGLSVGITLFFIQKLKKIIVYLILFIGLSFMGMFLIDVFSEEGIILLDSIGPILSILGFGVLFFGFFYYLISETPEKVGSKAKIE